MIFKKKKQNEYRYSMAEDDGEDPSFGFAQRPSVKGIKSKFGGSVEQIIKQIQQPQLSGQTKATANNLIQLTTANKTGTLQRPNSQIILTSHQLKGQDLAKLTGGQAVKISTQAIPIIQKASTNNQRHVYLIQQNQAVQPSQLAANFQQQQQQRTLIQAGATLPRNSTATLSAATNNLLTTVNTTTNSNTNLSGAGGGQRPSSSLGDNKDNQLKSNLNNLSFEQQTQTKGGQKIMYYHNMVNNVVNCNNVIKALSVAQPNMNAANLGHKVQATAAVVDNSLQYKTISTPNIALINGINGIKTAFITQQQVNSQQQQQQTLNNQSHPTAEPLKTGPKLITLVSANNKDCNGQIVQSLANPAAMKSSTIGKSPSSTNSSTSINSSSINSSSNASTATSSGTNSTANATTVNQCNNQSQSTNQLTNNSNLVKDANKPESDKTANASKLKQQVVNKDEMIFYSMNV